MIVDLRSDTLTKPTPGMMDAMMHAEVGDDVFGEDPSVNLLERRMADMFGKEAALYCPSGTQSNQIAIKVHTAPGDEVICETTAHVYQYEGGGIAFNASCQVKLVPGNQGRITAAQVESAINPDDVHKPETRLVCLENTHNRGGGSCYDFGDMEAISRLCRSKNIGLHLDGARLFNAIVARKENPADYGRVFDTLCICLNKGLGCPMGSVLLGSEEFIRKARRIRKVLGGGLRQAGFMAACGLYALDHHIDRLDEDHRHARLVADELQSKPFVEKLIPVETNIILFEVASGYDIPGLMQQLEKHGIRVIRMSPVQIRMVFHLDLTEDMIAHCVQVIRSL